MIACLVSFSISGKYLVKLWIKGSFSLLVSLFYLYFEVSVEYFYDLFVHQETGMFVAGYVEENGGFTGV